MKNLKAIKKISVTFFITIFLINILCINLSAENIKYKKGGILYKYDAATASKDWTVFNRGKWTFGTDGISVENNDKQIILKKSEDVYVLVPSVNKSFKIKSSWPTNASYPYLLQSLAKDSANDKDLITSETDTTYTIQTKIKMHADADAVNQKIIFSKETSLPSINL